MKQRLLAFAVLFLVTTQTAVTIAGTRDLAQKTANSKSVQSILYKGLAKTYKAEQYYGVYPKSVWRKESSLIVLGKEGRLSCESSSLHIQPVQVTSCKLEGKISIFQEGNVARTLYDALRNVRTQDYAELGQSSIRSKGGVLSVSDGKTTLACKSFSLGHLPVQQYECKILK